MYRCKLSIWLLIVGMLFSVTVFAAQHHATQAQLDRELIQALEKANHRKIVALLERGANPNVIVNEFGRTLLMDASGWGVEDEIRSLVKFGARINARDAEGDTALMYAVTKGRAENVNLLLRLHADANLRDKNRDTALSMAETALADNATTPFLHIDKVARHKYWKQIVRLLRKAGTRQSPARDLGQRSASTGQSDVK